MILDVDVNELPDSDTIPAGEYKLRIDGVGDIQQDKNQNEYITLELTVTEGEYANRKVFENYVPLSGKSLLKKILRASGFAQPKLSSTEDLIGLELTAIVKVEKSEKYGEQNRISAYVARREEPMAFGKGKGRK